MLSYNLHALIFEMVKLFRMENQEEIRIKIKEDWSEKIIQSPEISQEQQNKQFERIREKLQDESAGKLRIKQLSEKAIKNEKTTLA